MVATEHWPGRGAVSLPRSHLQRWKRSPVLDPLAGPPRLLGDLSSWWHRTALLGPRTAVSYPGPGSWLVSPWFLSPALPGGWRWCVQQAFQSCLGCGWEGGLDVWIKAEAPSAEAGVNPYPMGGTKTVFEMSAVPKASLSCRALSPKKRCPFSWQLWAVAQSLEIESYAQGRTGK